MSGRASAGILGADRIRRAVENEEIRIDPFDPTLLNPASYDLRLGTGVAVYDQWVMNLPTCDPQAGIGDNPPPHGAGLYAPPELAPFDIRQEPKVHRFVIQPEGWILKPGILYLMHTLERIATSSFVPVVDGKSSIGRLGIKVHETAGYGDPGFDGQYTLEVTVVHPVRVFAGMRIAQMRFHTLVHDGVAPPMLYRGHYRGKHAQGAAPSRAWMQFALPTRAVHCDDGPLCRSTPCVCDCRGCTAVRA